MYDFLLSREFWMKLVIPKVILMSSVILSIKLMLYKLECRIDLMIQCHSYEELEILRAENKNLRLQLQEGNEHGEDDELEL